MAVFTTVTANELAPWLADNYRLELQGEPQPITEGIENTNYRIVTKDGKHYIFTVIEVWEWEMATFCLSLANHLNQEQMPVPQSLTNAAGEPCTAFAGKPAAITEFVTGTSQLRPSIADCERMGATIANMHKAAMDFKDPIPNRRGAQWRAQAAIKIRPFLQQDERELLDGAMEQDKQASAAEMPQAACHCDLFRNNVLWHNGDIAGVIDFFFAGKDRLGFDLAVACNDWCMDDTGELDTDRLRAMIGAYDRCRQLTATERDHLPQLFVAAALRFWLSRHVDLIEPRPAATLVTHDPADFRLRLAALMDSADLIRSL